MTYNYILAINCYVNEEVFVYKSPKSLEMEASIDADVSHCVYETGSCSVGDIGYLLWAVDKSDKCKFEEWKIIKGRYAINCPQLIARQI